jgi:hypothetical protein
MNFLAGTIEIYLIAYYYVLNKKKKIFYYIIWLKGFMILVSGGIEDQAFGCLVQLFKC